MNDNRRFQRRFRNSAVFTCRVCGKRTRDTGHHEAELELCKRCLFEAYVENAASDYGTDSPEYRQAAADLAALES